MADQTKNYRLKPGQHGKHNGKQLGPTDVVQLTDAQAVAFADRFELVTEPAKPAEPAKEDKGTKK